MEIKKFVLRKLIFPLFTKFVEMLKTNKMPLSFDDLVKPVYILNAIQKSLDEGREVQISEVM